MSIYTLAERTVLKYTVSDAIKQAKDQVAGKVCLDSVANRPHNDLVTLEQLNELADAIVSDTKYWHV